MILTKRKYFFSIVLSLVCLNVFGQNGINGIKTIERNSIDNTPSSISFDANGAFEKSTAKSAFVNLFDIDEQSTKVVLNNTTTTKHGTSVERYDEYYNNIKIEQAGYTVLYNRGEKAVFMNGNYYNVNYPIQSRAQLTEGSARNIAIASVNAEKYAWEIAGFEQQIKQQKKDQTATHYPSGELVWIEDNTLEQQDRKLHLAYKFNVYAIKPLSREMIYVDAVNGKILHRNSLLHHTNGSGASLYSGTVNFKTTLSGGTYSLLDSTRGSGINTYTCASGDGSVAYNITSASSTFSSDAALDAHWGAEKVYDYWLNEQGRNSYNNAGGVLESYVHYLTGYNNAFWSGAEMVYGDGTGTAAGGFSPLTALDVCAHEIGHGVCQYTAALAYNRESGAMNEGFSDIWGAVIEDYANPHETDAVAKNMWKIGEEIATNPLRRMDAPNVRFQPDTYGGTYWVSVVGCTPTSGNDYCGVHTNSGVLNFWFYLMSQGGSGTNDISNAYSVSAIGTAKAADIAYQTELMLTATSTYANCRTASITAATTLYGSCSPEVEAVTKAWYAVGVGANYTGGSIAAITGTGTVCISATTILANATSGGTWSSSNTGVATVGTGSGIVSGVAAGTATISYVVSGGCIATTIATVNSLTTVNSITGTLSMCQGANTTLSSTTTGGVWSSSNSSIASVGTGTGIVSGVAAGTARITYSKTGVCNTATTTANVTVNTNPAGTGGTATVCTGATTTLTNTVTGGTWSSSATAIATVNTGGVVTGVAAGTSNITYTTTGGCFVTKTVTVTATPTVNAITGTTTLCQGATTVLSTTSTGGTWSSSNTTVATIGSTGNVNALTPGNTTISYTISNGCGTFAASTVLTINISPAAIGGTASICTGGSTTLTNSVSGGSWSSSNAGVATIGSTGDVFGMSAGTATITYAMPAACEVYKVVSVGITPTVNVISGTTTVCVSAATTLSNATSGGIWSSSNTSVATIGSSSGIATGIASGITTISYTITNSCTSVTTTINITVGETPAAITGIATLCAGNTTNLYNTVGGGTWTSSNAAIVTVDTSGIVSGISIGVATITYTLTSGCRSTKQVTVAATTASTGPSNVCIGFTITLANTVAGGYWSSTDTTLATVGPATGIVTGISVGTVNISYILPTGCYTIKSVTVQNTGTGITGTATVCAGSTTTLTSSLTSGSWSSSNSAIATVGSTGIVTGVISGTAVITYNVSGCFNVKTVTVNASPENIGGTLSVCPGSTTTLSNTVTGGTWSSSNTAKATIGSTTGIVTAVSLGTATISYTLSTGCYRTAQVTVGLPGSIGGPSNVCVGATITLTDSVTGGTWSCSNTALATIGSTSGVMTGISGGMTTITYTVSAGCYQTKSVYVQSLPLPIAGTASVCEAANTTLTCSSTGGSWTSGNTSVAIINLSTGVVLGVTAGTAKITYTQVGCFNTRDVTVNAIPAAITGTAVTCIGSTTTLANATSGGTWSSSNTAKATVGSATGTVTGVSAGTVTISYTTAGGCFATKLVTVGSMPAVITGTLTLCNGSITTLSTTTIGGTWSSSDASVATTGSAATSTSATITGTGTGNTTISYTVSGCSRTTVVTVNAGPGSITGNTAICMGSNSTLATTSTGGTWSSSATGVASVGTSGIVNGITAGTATISYRTSTTCYTTTVVTVSSTPAAITGTTIACIGYTATLSHAVTGGTWSSSNSAIASIDGTTGVVTGVATGAATVTYTLSAGCFKTIGVNVYALPSAITGTATVCAGSATTLADATAGGTWSSSDPSVATIPTSAGTVTGVTAGNTTITYRVTSTGCYTTKEVTVNTQPATITGSSTVCSGSFDTLSNATSGGTWTSSSATIAPIGATTGIVTGSTAGAATVSYTLANGCRRTMAITVYALPSALTGVLTVCAGNTTTLTSATAGQTWSSTNTAVATAGSVTTTTGQITGINTGVTTISYTNANGCARTANVTVNASLPANTGDNIVCVGQTITMANATTGGTWVSSTPAKATIGISTGLITGIAAGTTNITYSVGSGCLSITQVTVNAAMTTITGTLSVCVDQTTTLSHALAGGMWSSSNTAKATAESATGIVTGVSAGTAVITYMLGAGCYKTATLTVKAIPTAISGASAVTVGSTTTLTDATTGGTWSSSSTANAMVGSTSGIVTGVTAGSATITYRVTSTGCFATKYMDVMDSAASRQYIPETAVTPFSVYPNPTSGMLNIATNKGGVFAVYSIDGKEVASFIVNSGMNSIQLPSNLSSGVYMCRFSGIDNSTEVVRLIYEVR